MGRAIRLKRAPHPPFIADVATLDAMVILEVDGPHHDLQREADRLRRRDLESRGFRFRRVSADDAAQRPDAVIERLRHLVHSAPIV